MIVWCKNTKCKYNRFLDEPINFMFRKHYYVPFKDDLCYGECRRDEILINSLDTESKDIIYHFAYCVEVNNED